MKENKLKILLSCAISISLFVSTNILAKTIKYWCWKNGNLSPAENEKEYEEE